MEGRTYYLGRYPRGEAHCIASGSGSEQTTLLRTNLQTDPKAQTEGAPRTGNPLLLALSTQIVRDIVFSLRGVPGFFGERWEGPCRCRFV